MTLRGIRFLPNSEMRRMEPESAKSLAIGTLRFHETDSGRRSLQAFLLQRMTWIMVALRYPEHWRIGR